MAQSSYSADLSLLESFWKQRTFHDMSIERVDFINRRALIRLSEFTLVVTHTTHVSKDIEEFPTSWLSHQVERRETDFALHIDAELGWIKIVGRGVRLIRNDDLAMIVPKIDE